jgi:hypothetical protein
VCDVVGVPAWEAEHLLARARWDVDRCVGEYLADMDKVRAAAGLRAEAEDGDDHDVGNGLGDGENGGTITCNVCFDDEVVPEHALSVCGNHTFCHDCWGGHLRAAVSEALGMEIRCMAPKCGVCVNPALVVELLANDDDDDDDDGGTTVAGGAATAESAPALPPTANSSNPSAPMTAASAAAAAAAGASLPLPSSLSSTLSSSSSSAPSSFVPPPTAAPRTDAERYLSYRRRDLVSSNPHVRWCPAPGCGHAVLGAAGLAPTTAVQCACGAEFCFGCGTEPHRPTNCFDAQKWLRKCADTSETVNWIMVHTQPCPKCFQPIEKNGGCNHITHRACGAEFCWVCRGPWAEHGGNYNCNRFDESVQKDKEAAQAKLNRYMHYFRRYQNHHESRKLEAKLRTAATAQMAELQISGDAGSYAEVTYLLEACDMLATARGTLKWSYVKAYYLPAGEERTLFEFQQEELERTVETLSEILEGTAPLDAEGEPLSKDQVRMMVINYTGKLKTEQIHMKE